MSLLVLENIYKDFGGQNVLSGVSLRLERGERLALVGPNGAGKTTLINIAMGYDHCDSGRVVLARNVRVGHLSQDLKEVETGAGGVDAVLRYKEFYNLENRIRELEKQMGRLDKNSDSCSYKKLMNDYARLMVSYEAMDGYTIETKIKKILLGLGLRRETLATPPEKLSGGEKMRVSVARMLLEEPDLLILDEPTNHLDIQATEWFEGFLKKFKGGILFVSHDRYFLDRVATRVAELENGSVCVRSGNYSGYLDYKKQINRFVAGEQRRLKWAIKSINETVQGLKSRGKIKAWKSREREMKKLGEELKTGIKSVKKQVHLYGAGGPKIRFKNIRHVSKEIAWAENLKKSFGGVTLFSGASFHIAGGERVGIIGPNGCGKSTLINMLLGRDTDYEGFLRLGEWVKYSYMGQEVLFENEDMTMLELIVSRSDMQEREARDFLARFQFYGDDVEKSVRVLSGGERVRLYLALVMLEGADCLILDEPTNHLDVPARDAVESALREFKGTIIAVTHDRYYLTHCVEKILEIENGRINTYKGNYDLYKQLKCGINTESIEDEKESGPAAVSGKKSNKKNGAVKKDNNEKQRQEIEDMIMALEDKIKEMEALFNESTPVETYREYGDLLQEKDRLYGRWNDLIS